VTITREQEEHYALLYLCNGNGSHPVPKENLLAEICDEVVVAIPLEDHTEVHIFLRKNKSTIRQYTYELRRTN
jgi:hypothetical protein